jgi:hypothetical protein
LICDRHRDEWRDIETGEAVKSRTIIFTDANALAGTIHAGGVSNPSRG